MKNPLRKVRDTLDKYSLLPTFSEDTIFLMVVALGVIYFVDTSAQKEIYETLRSSEKMMLIAGAGVLFTLYTTFFTRFKTETQKHYMLWFALIINLVVGVTAFSSLAERDISLFWYLLPALNIATFFIVIVLWYAGLYSTGRLSTKSNSYSNIIYGTLALIAIAFIYKYIPNTNWQMVFSTSIGYATLFSKTITQYLPKLFSDKEDRTNFMQNLIERTTDTALEIINIHGLSSKQIIITTENDSSVHDMHNDKKSSDLTDVYLNNLAALEFPECDVALTVLGTYEWTQSWWSKTKSYTCLIINIYLKDESKRYEFYQILQQGDGEFVVSDWGLIYQSAEVVQR